MVVDGSPSPFHRTDLSATPSSPQHGDTDASMLESRLRKAKERSINALAAYNNEVTSVGGKSSASQAVRLQSSTHLGSFEASPRVMSPHRVLSPSRAGGHTQRVSSPGLGSVVPDNDAFDAPVQSDADMSRLRSELASSVQERHAMAHIMSGLEDELSKAKAAQVLTGVDKLRSETGRAPPPPSKLESDLHAMTEKFKKEKKEKERLRKQIKADTDFMAKVSAGIKTLEDKLAKEKREKQEVIDNAATDRANFEMAMDQLEKKVALSKQELSRVVQGMTEQSDERRWIEQIRSVEDELQAVKAERDVLKSRIDARRKMDDQYDGEKAHLVTKIEGLEHNLREATSVVDDKDREIANLTEATGNLQRTLDVVCEEKDGLVAEIQRMKENQTAEYDEMLAPLQADKSMLAVRVLEKDESYVKERTAMRKEIAVLRTSISDFEASTELLKKENASFQESMAAMEEQLNEMTSNRNTMSKRALHAETKCKDQEAEINRMERRLAEMNDRVLEAVEDRDKALADQMARMHEQLERAIEKERAERDRLMYDAKQQIVDSKNEAETKLENATRRRLELEEVVERLENQSLELKRKLMNRVVTLWRNRHCLSAFENWRRTTVETRHTRFKQETERWQTDLSMSPAQENRVVRIKMERDTLARQVEEVKRQMVDLSGERERESMQLKARLESALDAERSAREELDLQLHQTQVKLSQAEARNAVLDETQDKYRAKADRAEVTMQSEVRQYQSAISELKQQLYDKKKEADRLAFDVEKYSKALEKSEEEREDIINRYKHVVDDFRDYETEAEGVKSKLSDENRGLQKELANLQRKLDELEVAVGDGMKKAEDDAAIIRDLTAEKTDLKSVNGVLEADIRQISEHLKNAKRDLDLVTNKADKSAEREIELEKSLSRNEAEKTREFERLRQENTALQEQIDIVEKDLLDEKRRYLDLENEYVTLKDESLNATKRLEEGRAHVERVREARARSALTRWKSEGMLKAFEKWRGHHLSLRRKYTSVARVLARVQRLTMRNAYNGWRVTVAILRVENTMERGKKVTEEEVMEANKKLGELNDKYKEKIQHIRERAVNLTILKWRNHAIASAWSQWREARRSSVMEKDARERITSVSESATDLEKSLHELRATHAQKMEERNETLAKVREKATVQIMRRILNVQLSVAFRTWFNNVEESRRTKRAAEIEAKDAEISQKDASLDELTKELDILRGDITSRESSLGGELENLRGMIRQKEDALSELKASIKDNEAKLSAAEAEVARLSEQSQAATAESDSRSQELADVKSTLESREAQLSTLAKQLEAKHSDDSEELRHAREDLERTSLEWRNAQSELAQAQQEVAKISQLNSQLEYDLNTSKDEAAQAGDLAKKAEQARIAALEELDKLKAEYESLGQSIQKQKEGSEGLEETVRLLTAKNEELEEEVKRKEQATTQQKDLLDARLKEVEGERDSIRQKLQDLTNELNEYRSEASRNKEEATRLAREAEAQQAQVDESVAAMEGLVGDQLEIRASPKRDPSAPPPDNEWTQGVMKGGILYQYQVNDDPALMRQHQWVVVSPDAKKLRWGLDTFGFANLLECDRIVMGNESSVWKQVKVADTDYLTFSIFMNDGTTLEFATGEEEAFQMWVLGLKCLIGEVPDEDSVNNKMKEMKDEARRRRRAAKKK